MSRVVSKLLLVAKLCCWRLAQKIAPSLNCLCPLSLGGAIGNETEVTACELAEDSSEPIDYRLGTIMAYSLERLW